MNDLTKMPVKTGMRTRDALDWVFLFRNGQIAEKTGINIKTIEHCRWQHKRGQLSEFRINKILTSIFKKENELWHTKT